jgi:hypothetical protein
MSLNFDDNDDSDDFHIKKINYDSDSDEDFQMKKNYDSDYDITPMSSPLVKRKANRLFQSPTKRSKPIESLKPIEKLVDLNNEIDLSKYILNESIRIQSFKELHRYLLDIKRKGLLCTEDAEWIVEKRSFVDSGDMKDTEAFKVFTKNELLGGIGTKLLKDNNYSRCEILYYKYFTNLVLENQTPNFPLVSVSQECDLCIGNQLNLEEKCLLVFSELADGSASNLFPPKRISENKKKDIFGMLTQVLMACLVLETHGIVHGDLHLGNILYHNEKEEQENSGKYLHYFYKNYHIYVLHQGKLWVLWDFGLMTSNNKLNARDDENYTSLKTDVRRILRLVDMRLNNDNFLLENFVDHSDSVFDLIIKLSENLKDIINEDVIIISENELQLPLIKPIYNILERSQSIPICSIEKNI